MNTLKKIQEAALVLLLIVAGVATFIFAVAVALAPYIVIGLGLYWWLA